VARASCPREGDLEEGMGEWGMTTNGHEFSRMGKEEGRMGAMGMGEPKTLGALRVLGTNSFWAGE